MQAAASLSRKKNPLDGLTPEQQQAEIDHAKKVLASSSEYVINGFEEHLEQALALAQVISNRLTPIDPDNIDDDHPFIEWRLSQLLKHHLEDASSIRVARDFLLGEG